MNSKYGWLLTVSFVVTAGLVFHGTAHVKPAPKHQITWVLAHEPVTVFERAAKEFAENVKNGTQGEIEVRVVSASDFYGKKMRAHEIINDVRAGKIQLSQMHTTELAFYGKNLRVLDMPYLFRDHDHATKVLEGEIGQELLAQLSDDGMKGLAFTYSGGFRILPSVGKPVRRPEDLKGMRVRVSRSPVAQKTFTALGAFPHPASPEDGSQGMVEGLFDAAETTFPRVIHLGSRSGAKWLNDTGHSLFLTSIVINKEFFDSLPESHRKAIESAALSAARVERAQSIADGVAAKSELSRSASGTNIVSLTPEEQELFKRATASVYRQFPEYSKLVARIRAVK